MKAKFLGSILKLTAVVILAIVVRYEVNPVLYLLLGMLFYTGWKIQHQEEPIVLRVPTKQKQHTSVVAKRI